MPFAPYAVSATCSFRRGIKGPSAGNRSIPDFGKRTYELPAAISALERKGADISSVRVARHRSAPASILKSWGTFCNREQRLSFDTNDTKSIADDILAIHSAGMVARLDDRIDVSRKRTSNLQLREPHQVDKFKDKRSRRIRCFNARLLRWGT
jgi:hypothetical protein